MSALVLRYTFRSGQHLTVRVANSQQTRKALKDAFTAEAVCMRGVCQHSGKAFYIRSKEILFIETLEIKDPPAPRAQTYLELETQNA